MIKKYSEILFITLTIAFISNNLKAENITVQNIIEKNTNNNSYISDNDTNNNDANNGSKYENDEIQFAPLFETFLTSQNNLINHTMISFSTGISFNILPENIIVNSNNMNTNKLSNLQSFAFEYGFVRFDSAFKYDRLRAYSSEFAFIENNTNKFGIYKKAMSTIYDNEFSFGVGLRSGFGIKSNEYQFFELYLLHSSAFNWTNFDYAQYENSKFFTDFDNNTKFGFRGAASAELRLSKNLFLDLEYEHINIFSNMEYGKWFGSWTIDFIIQRWIDIFDPIFINRLEGYKYPFIKFFYKNSVAIILSELRNLQQFYPFKSDYSLLQRKLIFKIKFIF